MLLMERPTEGIPSPVEATKARGRRWLLQSI
jgi:hypothetical protein